MFLVTDLTGKAPRMTMINDVKMVRDVVIGITGDSKAGDAILGVAGYMRFGDEFICQPHFKVNCVRETDAETWITNQIAAAATRLLTTCTDDYAIRIWDRIEALVVADVLECTDNCEDGFTSGDVALAIGRAIAKQFDVDV